MYLQFLPHQNTQIVYNLLSQKRQIYFKNIKYSTAVQQMQGKKRGKAKQDEDQDDNDSELEREMQEFNSNEPWSDLDELEKELFYGINPENSDQMENNPKKRDRRKEREDQIAEYEEALRIAEKDNDKYVNPFQKYELNVDIEEYRKMLFDVVEGTRPPQGVARILGLKSLRILHNERLFMQFNLAKTFLEDLQVPSWIKQAHEQLITDQPKQ